ncbi:hypothetical protein HYU21_03090 [Candidatus Woesearchaeota archaeon]|nr:hypothetical protein [Candidatus Woesearchaeota archaeon]
MSSKHIPLLLLASFTSFADFNYIQTEVSSKQENRENLAVNFSREQMISQLNENISVLTLDQRIDYIAKNIVLPPEKQQSKIMAQGNCNIYFLDLAQVEKPRGILQIHLTKSISNAHCSENGQMGFIYHLTKDFDGFVIFSNVNVKNKSYDLYLMPAQSRLYQGEVSIDYAQKCETVIHDKPDRAKLCQQMAETIIEKVTRQAILYYQKLQLQADIKQISPNIN